MTPSSTIELFAGELRRLRSRAGLSQEALADKVKYSTSLVAAVEQCRRSPQRDFVKACDEVLDADGLLSRIRGAALQDSSISRVREWAVIESEARVIRSFQPLVVPGLFQTEAYARAICERGSLRSSEEIEQIIATRLARQVVLDSSPIRMFVAVMDGSVLQRPVGGPETMRLQLQHLLHLADRPNIHLHVVPTDVGEYAGLAGPMVIASPEEGSDTAYADGQANGMVIDRPAEVKAFNEIWESIRAEALPRRQTIDVITEAVRQWT